jgi:hypothetical protein
LSEEEKEGFIGFLKKDILAAAVEIASVKTDLKIDISSSRKIFVRDEVGFSTG